METPARLTVDLGRLDEGRHEHLKGALSRVFLEVDDLEQLRPEGDVEYDLQCELLGDELLVRGTLQLACACICSRCGQTYHTKFSEKAYCESFEIAGTEILDLTESVREGIILALPSYPICKEDCKGICFHCGQDLNVSACRCAKGETNSPWDALDGWMV